MFRSIKRVITVAAVVAMGTLAAPAAAEQWTIDGSTPYSGSAKATGVLTASWAGTTTTCDVELALDLTNPGGVAHGDVTAVALGAAAGGTCVTTVPGCTVTIGAIGPSLPWAVSTNATSATIHHLAYHLMYTGANCPLANTPIAGAGSVTGSVIGGIIAFVNAGPLTTTLGMATVDGSLAVSDTSSNPVSMF